MNANIYLKGLLGQLTELSHMKCLEQYLAHGKCSVSTCMCLLKGGSSSEITGLLLGTQRVFASLVPSTCLTQDSHSFGKQVNL